MEDLSIKDIFINVGYLLLFINLIIYSKSFRIKAKAFRCIIYYLVFTSIIQLLSSIIAESNKTINNGNNLFLSHYYFIGQFLILSCFFYTLLNSTLKKRIIIILGTIVPIYLISFLILNPEIYHTFSLTEAVICSLTIVLYTIFYFMESFGVANKKYLIFNSGIFIYLLSTTLIFSSGNLLLNASKEVHDFVWSLNAVIYIFFQILIFFEWYKNFRKIQLTNTP